MVTDVERYPRCERSLVFAGEPHDCRTMQERISALAARAKANPPRIEWKAPDVPDAPEDAWRGRADLG